MWRLWWAMGLWIGVLVGALGLDVARVTVCAAPGEQSSPEVVLRADGGWFVLWHDLRDNDRDLYGQRFDPNGQPLWEKNGRLLVGLPHDQGWPVALADGAGGFFLVWGDSRAVDWEPGAGGRHLFMQRFDPDGRPLWDPPTGLPVATQAKGTDDHILTPDGTGGFYVAWEDWRNTNQDIYAQHVLPDGSTAWPPEGLPLSSATSDQYDPIVASDGQGGLLATWWNVEGPRWTVSAQRMTADGQPIWGPEGVLVAESPANQAAPTIATGPDGGAYVVWVDFRNDPGAYANLDVFAQRLLPDGNRAWDAAGLPLTQAPENQQTPVMLSLPDREALVVWVDARDVYEDLYGQRLHPAGGAWPEEGLPLVRTGGRQRQPALAFDGQTFWMVWYDYRREYDAETFEDLYVQRFDRSGRLLEAPTGVPIWTDGGRVSHLALAAEGGRAVVAWAVAAEGEADLFAAHLRVSMEQE